MENQTIELAGAICHALMMGQVWEKELLFKRCCLRYDWLTMEKFNEVLVSLNKGCAITGITDKHIYQTTSGLLPQKTHEEVMSIVRQ